MANDLGNLAQRTLAMISKNYDGIVPYPGDYSETEFRSMESLKLSQKLPKNVSLLIHRQAFHLALERIWEVIRDSNKAIDQDEPWKLKKTDETAMGTVLWLQAETMRNLAIVLRPFIPDAMDQLLNQLGVPNNERKIMHLSQFEEGILYGKYSVKPGSKLPRPSPIFPKYLGTIEG